MHGRSRPQRRRAGSQALYSIELCLIAGRRTLDNPSRRRAEVFSGDDGFSHPASNRCTRFRPRTLSAQSDPTGLAVAMAMPAPDMPSLNEHMQVRLGACANQPDSLASMDRPRSVVRYRLMRLFGIARVDHSAVRGKRLACPSGKSLRFVTERVESRRKSSFWCRNNATNYSPRRSPDNPGGTRLW